MRPFSTLGLKPFLWAEKSDLEAIQKIYFKLSRESHPDSLGVNASDEERERAEAHSSRLNFDYSQVKDLQKRLENVASQDPNCPKMTRNGPPPEFAEDYFDLQEKLSEDGTSAEVAKLAGQLKEKVENCLKRSQTELELFAKRFKFEGPGDSPPIWNEKDLAVLRKSLEDQRYFKSFLRDFDSKFKFA